MYNNEDHIIDIIREIINIGIGEAANSLSKLVNTRIIIKVPNIHIVSTVNINEYLIKEIASLGVYMSQDFRGLIKGKTLLFYTEECSVSLLNAIYGQTFRTTSLTESGIATLNEIGNIIMGSCMSEISNMIEGRISFDLPEVTVEVSETYFRNLLKELDNLDKAIIVKNEMRIKDTDIKGYLFVLLSFEDFRLVIEMLQGKVK
jgi:chemotaxis protein CheC